MKRVSADCSFDGNDCFTFWLHFFRACMLNACQNGAHDACHHVNPLRTVFTFHARSKTKLPSQCYDYWQVSRPNSRQLHVRRQRSAPLLGENLEEEGGKRMWKWSLVRGCSSKLPKSSALPNKIPNFRELSANWLLSGSTLKSARLPESSI